MHRKIAVIGSGAMATACSILLSDHGGQSVTMWSRNPENARSIRERRENSRLLPGVHIPESIGIVSDFAEAVDGADLLIASIPSRFLREALTGLKPHLTRQRPVISVIKGIENKTFLRPSQIITDVLGPRGVVALCGPSHAEEISRRLPASVVAASDDEELARVTQEIFTTDRFRVYTNSDLVGVELAGALKNVIAIAAGISDGLGFGDNAKSALMTRGQVEMTRFGEAFGASRSTFAGLAGMGDLITTCCSPHGRNRHVGERLGKGEPLQQILDSMNSVAEGVTTTRSVYEIAEQQNIDMPITRSIYRVLFEGLDPAVATSELMMRPSRPE
jgi:glycerol-3-phosphate dehydrogenase (NAD(P)+)